MLIGFFVDLLVAIAVNYTRDIAKVKGLPNPPRRCHTAMVLLNRWAVGVRGKAEGDAQAGCDYR
jgi:hypothetical protein